MFAREDFSLHRQRFGKQGLGLRETLLLLSHPSIACEASPKARMARWENLPIQCKGPFKKWLSLIVLALRGQCLCYAHHRIRDIRMFRPEKLLPHRQSFPAKQLGLFGSIRVLKQVGEIAQTKCQPRIFAALSVHSQGLAEQRFGLIRLILLLKRQRQGSDGIFSPDVVTSQLLCADCLCLSEQRFSLSRFLFHQE